MPLQAVDELPILSIEHPDKEIFTTCDKNITFRMPFQKIHVLTGPILKCTFEREIIVCIPDPNLIVHASSCHQLAIMIELYELYSLCMSRQMLMQHCLEFWNFSCRFLIRTAFALFLFFFCPFLLILHYLPYYCLVVAISRDKCIEGLSRKIIDAKYGILVIVISTGKLHH